MRRLILACFCTFSLHVDAAQWVNIDLSAGNSTYQKAGASNVKAKSVRLARIPYVKLSWFDENDVLIEKESVVDPRAIWSLLEDDEHGASHEAVILTHQERFKLRKPDGALSLDIEYLNLDLSSTSRKLRF